MGFNWQEIGIELVRLLLSCAFSLVLGGLFFKKYVAPPILESLASAEKTVKTIAGLGGIKKADYATTQELSKAVTLDLIKTKFPELELIKMALSPSTWEQVEEAMETNPAGVMDLIEKYGHYFTQDAQGNQEQYQF